MLNWISNLKNELVDHEAAAGKADNPTEEIYAEAYETYQARLQAANAMDFDDLIMNTVHLFQAWPDVRETYRRRFRHILVDEYQDTNHAQYQLIKELTDEESDLLVVGDSDQSIYAFRGANIRNILEFEDDFPNAATILLEQNYRSTQTILSAANAVISRNEGRKDKQLWSAEGDGEKIVGYVGDDERDEAQFIADEIDKLADDGDAGRQGRRDLLPHQRAEPGLRGGLHPGRPALPRRRRRPLLRAQGDQGRAGLRPRARQPARRGLAAAHHQRAQARHRRAGRGRDPAPGDAPRTSASGRRCTRADEATDLATRSLNAIQAFTTVMSELMAMADVGAPADAVLEAALTRSGYLSTLEQSTDPQDETRVENLAELVAVAREFVVGPARRRRPVAGAGSRRRGALRRGRRDLRRARPGRRIARLRSSSRSPWSPTPTRSPTRATAS